LLPDFHSGEIKISIINKSNKRRIEAAASNTESPVDSQENKRLGLGTGKASGKEEFFDISNSQSNDVEVLWTCKSGDCLEMEIMQGILPGREEKGQERLGTRT